jgi:hypothetical protein
VHLVVGDLQVGDARVFLVGEHQFEREMPVDRGAFGIFQCGFHLVKCFVKTHIISSFFLIIGKGKRVFKGNFVGEK